MIKIIAAYLKFDGENYSPQSIENKVGKIFSKKNKVGELGTRGKYRDKPLPYGSGTIYFSHEELDNITDEDLLSTSSDTFIQVKENIQLLKMNSDFSKFHLQIAYDNQCNMDFSPSLLKAISNLEIDLTISCYRDESEFEDQTPK